MVLNHIKDFIIKNLTYQTIYNYDFIRVFQIVFGFIGFIIALNTYEAKTFLFPSYIEHSIFINSLFFLWFTTSFFLIIGLNHLLVRLLLYIVSSYLLIENAGVFSIEPKFYIYGAFFNVFFLNKKQKEVCFKYNPVVIMLIGLGAMLFLNGFITKIQDPNWRTGAGMLMVLSSKHLRFEYMSFLLDSKYLMMILGYVALLFEGALLFTSFFKKTRLIAVLIFTSFAFLLIGFLRVNQIGSLAVAFCIPLISLFPATKKINTIFLKKIDITYYLNIDKNTYFFQAYYKKITFMLYVGLILSMSIPVSQFVSQNFNLGPGNRFLDIFSRTLEKPNRYTYNIRYGHLFTSRHLVDVYAFRIILRDSQGKEYEPIQVFKEDQSPGIDSKSFFSSRWLQAEMYYVDHYGVQKYDYGINRLIRLFEFAGYRAEIPSKSIGFLLSSRIEIPTNFNEEIKNKTGNVTWDTLATYNYSRSKLNITR